MSKCKICGKPTNVFFGIKLEKTYICESCATLITLQQVTWWSKQSDKLVYEVINSEQEKGE